MKLETLAAISGGLTGLAVFFVMGVTLWVLPILIGLCILEFLLVVMFQDKLTWIEFE
jgi:hypothetical protein